MTTIAAAGSLLSIVGFWLALADGREDKLDAAIWKTIRPDGNELVAG